MNVLTWISSVKNFAVRTIIYYQSLPIQQPHAAPEQHCKQRIYQLSASRFRNPNYTPSSYS